MQKDRLSAEQSRKLHAWLPGHVVVRDHSWGPSSTLVLEVDHAGTRYLVKAGGAKDHHIERELRAYHEWVTPWSKRGRAPSLVYGNVSARILVTTLLPGILVKDSQYEVEPSIYEQTGRLLAQLHNQTPVLDDTYEARENARACICYQAHIVLLVSLRTCCGK